MSIDVSSMPFPASGISNSPLSRHDEEAPTGPRKARPDDRLRAVSDHEAPSMASPFETLAAQAPQGEGVDSSFPNLRRDVGNCLHHGIAHAGIVERVAGALDDADL